MVYFQEGIRIKEEQEMNDLQNGYDSYEAEIDLVDLIFHILSKYRWIIIAGLLGLGLLGGYKFYQAEGQRASFQAAKEAGDEAALLANAAYKAADNAIIEKKKANNDIRTKAVAKEMEVSNAEAAVRDARVNRDTAVSNLEYYENQKDILEAELSEAGEYAENSVYLNLNPYDCSFAKTVFKVKLSEEDDSLYRDPADAVLFAYESEAVLDAAAQGVSEKLGIEKRYAGELIIVEGREDADTVTVTAFGTDGEMAKEVLSEAEKAIKKASAGISQSYRAHTLLSLGTEEGSFINEDLIEEKTAVRERIDSYKKDLIGCNANIGSRNSAKEKAEADEQNQTDKVEALKEELSVFTDSLAEGEAELQKLEEAKLTAGPARSGSLKSGIKYGIIGLVAGFFCMALWYCAVYVLNGKVHTADEVKNLSRIPVLGVLRRNSGKKENAIDRRISSLRNASCGKDEDILQSAAATASALLPSGKLAILSSVDTEKVKDTAEKLGGILKDTEITLITDLTGEKGIEELKNADGVILVEEREKSKVRDVIAVLETAQVLDKTPKGVIVL